VPRTRGRGRLRRRLLDPRPRRVARRGTWLGAARGSAWREGRRSVQLGPVRAYGPVRHAAAEPFALTPPRLSPPAPPP
jgi:hypothetical protein